MASFVCKVLPCLIQNIYIEFSRLNERTKFERWKKIKKTKADLN